jgi:hypothetical protein
MPPPDMNDKDLERVIDIIGDGELTADAQVQLRREGLWLLYESLLRTSYEAFCLGTNAQDLEADGVTLRVECWAAARRISD